MILCGFTACDTSSDQHHPALHENKGNDAASPTDNIPDRNYRNDTDTSYKKINPANSVQPPAGNK